VPSSLFFMPRPLRASPDGAAALEVHRAGSASGLAPAAALIIASLFAGCAKTPPPAPRTPPTVIVKPVARTDSARELRLSGALSAERSVSLGFATLGTVQQVMVDEGQAVRRGQTLAVLVPRTYQDALGIAKAKADQAEDAYRRLQPMYSRKTLPEVKMVEVETGRAQARLAVSMARKNLEDTVLKAPVAGIISSRHVNAGASAAPGLPAFTLVQTATMMATAPVPEMQVAKIKRGAPARVTIPALGKTLDGAVREIAVIANPLTRTYDVKVALPNPAGELRVGMIADVHLGIGGDGGELVVPPAAIRVDERGATYVFVVSNNTLQRRPVTVARFVGEGTALTEGVREGELVVTSGTPMLADGLTVRLDAPRGEAAPATTAEKKVNP
jgi:membrane fusion protein, multidrug efflux system